jgi:hypothetical protein
LEELDKTDRIDLVHVEAEGDGGVRMEDGEGKGEGK